MFRKQPLIVIPPARSETRYVTRDIHEHRAPTDESVKLLKEFEDAADKRRVETLHLEDNAFSGTIFIEHRAYGCSFVARAVCDLNGHRLTVDEEVALTSKSQHETRAELLLKLRDKLAQKIAGEVLIEFARRAA